METDSEMLAAIENPTPRFLYRQQYDLNSELVAHDQTAYRSEKPSKTQTHFKNDVDLNIMLKRMGVKDGAIPPQALDPKYFGDFRDVPDFRQSMDNLRDALDKFNQLPAALRARFHNDPAALYEFVTNEANVDEAVKLGLLKKVEGLDTNAPKVDTSAPAPSSAGVT